MKSPAGGQGAGAVNVIYGSASGLTTSGNQLFSQNAPGISDTSEPGDVFGDALATGGFNGDGRADLAVGVPGEAIGNVTGGAVNVIYGSASGLTATGNQFFSQNTAGILDASEPGDDFGVALATGGYNGDGRADLAVGVRGEVVGGADDAGAVNVIYGSANGLTETDSFFSQNTSGIAGASEPFDHFGAELP